MKSLAFFYEVSKFDHRAPDRSWQHSCDQTGVHHMPEAFSASLSAISSRRPNCPKCQARMSLARITPGPKGFDQRTFECGNCEYVHREAVATDKMKSLQAGWIDGDLKAPT
jgi:transposase-like protein